MSHNCINITSCFDNLSRDELSALFVICEDVCPRGFTELHEFAVDQVPLGLAQSGHQGFDAAVEGVEVAEMGQHGERGELVVRDGCFGLVDESDGKRILKFGQLGLEALKNGVEDASCVDECSLAVIDESRGGEYAHEDLEINKLNFFRGSQWVNELENGLDLALCYPEFITSGKSFMKSFFGESIWPDSLRRFISLQDPAYLRWILAGLDIQRHHRFRDVRHQLGRHSALYLEYRHLIGHALLQSLLHLLAVPSAIFCCRQTLFFNVICSFSSLIGLLWITGHILHRQALLDTLRGHFWKFCHMLVAQGFQDVKEDGSAERAWGREMLLDVGVHPGEAQDVKLLFCWIFWL